MSQNQTRHGSSAGDITHWNRAEGQGRGRKGTLGLAPFHLSYVAICLTCTSRLARACASEQFLTLTGQWPFVKKLMDPTDQWATSCRCSRGNT